MELLLELYILVTQCQIAFPSFFFFFFLFSLSYGIKMQNSKQKKNKHEILPVYLYILVRNSPGDFGHFLISIFTMLMHFHPELHLLPFLYWVCLEYR